MGRNLGYQVPRDGEMTSFWSPFCQRVQISSKSSSPSTHTPQEELVFAEIQKLFRSPSHFKPLGTIFLLPWILISQIFYLDTCPTPLTTDQCEAPPGGPQRPQTSSIPCALPWRRSMALLTHPPVHSLLTELATSGSFLLLQPWAPGCLHSIIALSPCHE